MEVINGQKGFTKFGVAKHAVPVFVESAEEGLHFVGSRVDPETAQSSTDELQRNCALAVRIQ